jgi:hypothetical protein
MTDLDALIEAFPHDASARRVAVDSLEWFFGAGRKAMGSTSLVRSNEPVTVRDLYEALDTGPDLLDV